MATQKIPTKVKSLLVDCLEPVTQKYKQIIKVAIVDESSKTTKYKANPINYIGWITNKSNFLFAYGVNPDGTLHGLPPKPMEKFDEYIGYHKYDVLGIYDVDELKNIINKTKTKTKKVNKKENKIMLENTNTNVNVATPVNEATPAPAIDVPAIPATPVTEASVPAGAIKIDNVADFLKMVHTKKTGLSENKIKVSLDEIKSRLGGKIKIMAVEKTQSEGRNFYVVQIDESAYMFSFKHMTTTLSKWEDACGGIDKLNEMLAQANIVGVITDSEYNGKRYSKFDIE